jgi:hypothetical protein
MNVNPTYPYTLDIHQSLSGHFQWTIREHGKLLERSDRSHPSERVARARGQAALEILFVKARDDRRR